MENKIIKIEASKMEALARCLEACVVLWQADMTSSHNDSQHHNNGMLKEALEFVKKIIPAEEGGTDDE